MQALIDRLRRVPTWAWALLFSVLICLPGLGSFGFWDPWELKLADQAREISRSSHLFDPTANGKYTPTKALGFGLAAWGLRIFGVSEWGARMFVALAAIGAMMAVYWAGAGLFRRRAALLATLVLGSMTLFVLEARQLTSDAPLIAALALALGGLGRYAWPPSGRRRLVDVAIALAGMGLGYLAGGALTGVVLPILAITAAVVVGYGLRPGGGAIDDGTGELASAGVGPDLPSERTFGASTLRPGSRAFLVLAVLTAGALAILIASLVGNVAGKYSALLGGVPRGGAPTRTFETLVRQLGFGLFPWSAVAVFALARPLIRLDANGNTNPRLAFAQLYLFAFAGLGFAFSTYLSLVLGDVRYVALPAIALAVGAFLDEALEGNRSEPVAGLLMGTGTMIVARDFFLAPEELASVHLFEKVRWPMVVSIGYLLLAAGLLTAAGVYAGLAARGRALGKIPGRDLSGARPWRRVLGRATVAAGRWGLQAAVGCALVFALYLAHVLVPTLSTHFSFKPILKSYSKLARSGEKIAKYRVEGHGSGFYGSDSIVEVPSQDRLLTFLRDPNRVFALVPTDELAPLDAAFKQAKQPYYVVDASSSRFLLLTNQLPSGQSDENPLKKFVWMAPTPPNAAGEWQPNEKPPWTWRIPLSATFGDTIELVGADFPPTVRRPGKIPLDLYFRVKGRPPGGFKIFVHFDGPSAPRVIGDHDPVGKVFSTAYWLPGEYVKDHYETDVPLMTTPAGTYTVYMGFWPGGEGRRLKITQGPNDGSDRVRLGTLEVK